MVEWVEKSELGRMGERRKVKPPIDECMSKEDSLPLPLAVPSDQSSFTQREAAKETSTKGSGREEIKLDTYAEKSAEAVAASAASWLNFDCHTAPLCPEDETDPKGTRQPSPEVAWSETYTHM